MEQNNTVALKFKFYAKNMKLEKYVHFIKIMIPVQSYT